MSEIKNYQFSKNGISRLSQEAAFGNNWPIVYIINNSDSVYIGETANAFSRMNQHLHDEKKSLLKDIHIVYDDRFNKSATLHIESLLIEHISADGSYRKMLNGNNGQIHHYYQRDYYNEMFSNIWKSLKNKNLVQHELNYIRNLDLFKFSPYKSLTQDQYDVAMNIIQDIFSEEFIDGKKTYIVRGGAGTGKSVLAVYLAKLFSDFSVENFERILEDDIELLKEKIETLNTDMNLKIGLVIPMQSLRKTIRKVFKSIDGLSPKMVLSPNDVTKEKYDLLIVDEAHRLRRRNNLTNYDTFDKNNLKLGLYKSGDELDWIMMQSDYQIMFYDAIQSIKPTDIKAEKIESLINSERTEIFQLESQMRVIGGNDYINYIVDILNCRAESAIKFNNYDFRLFKDFESFMNIIKEKDSKYGLSRAVAGYSWPWVSKKNPSATDISIEGHEYKWNTTSEDWVNSPDSINEIGCIHTIQGYDLNYVGVIFGNEIGYNKQKQCIEIYKNNYYDRNGKAGIDDLEELNAYIRNIYFTMLTRGIRGTYVYVCNDDLREYLQKYIKLV